jgi:hypothetical protein
MQPYTLFHVESFIYIYTKSSVHDSWGVTKIPQKGVFLMAYGWSALNPIIRSLYTGVQYRHSISAAARSQKQRSRTLLSF